MPGEVHRGPFRHALGHQAEDGELPLGQPDVVGRGRTLPVGSGRRASRHADVRAHEGGGRGHESAHLRDVGGRVHDAETEQFAAWEKLDLAGLLAFARETMDPTRGEAALAEVHSLFRTYAEHTGFLRLRHTTTAMRARVDKAALPEQAPPPDTLLLDFR